MDNRDGNPSEASGRHRRDRSDDRGHDKRPEKPRGDKPRGHHGDHDDSEPGCGDNGGGDNGDGNGNDGNGTNGGDSGNSGGGNGGGNGGSVAFPTIDTPTIDTPTIPDVPGPAAVTVSPVANQSGVDGGLAFGPGSGRSGGAQSRSAASPANELMPGPTAVDVPIRPVPSPGDADIGAGVPTTNPPEAGGTTARTGPVIGSMTGPVWPPANFRAGYSPFLRSADINQVAFLAIPGVAGIIALTVLGGYLGYRQAKSGLAVRAAGTARFLS